jgi:hypothetical protein
MDQVRGGGRHRPLPGLVDDAGLRALGGASFWKRGNPVMTSLCSVMICTVGFLLPVFRVNAEPVPVRHVQGYLHGFVVLKDVDEKVLASGDVTQTPGANRVTTLLSLHFKDGSLYQETAVFSQRRVFKLLTYKQVQKGPSFKTQQTFNIDASTGKVSLQYTDKDGAEKTIDDKLALPPDLANGILPTLLTDADPKVENTLSMLVTTPKPRLVKLKISPTEQDSFTVGGAVAKATHYIVKIDIGGVTGVVAKVAGKQPAPLHFWIAAGNAPVFLKSEGPLFEDGPIWRIEQVGPTWPKAPQKQ